MERTRYNYFNELLGKTYHQDDMNLDDKVEYLEDGDFSGEHRSLADDFRSVLEEYEPTRLTGSLYEVRLTEGYNIDRVEDDDIAAEGVVKSTDVVDGLEASVMEEFKGPWDLNGFQVERMNRLEGDARHNWRYQLSKPDYKSNIDLSLFKPGREPGSEYSKFDP